MGGWESRDEKKGSSDKGQTSLPENRISTASNSGLCEADPPQGEMGNNTGSRRDQTSLVAWRILWLKVVLSCFGGVFLVFRQGQIKQALGCEGWLAHKVSATSQHQLALALSAAPSSLAWHWTWYQLGVTVTLETLKGYMFLHSASTKHQNSAGWQQTTRQKLGFLFLFLKHILLFSVWR